MSVKLCPMTACDAACLVVIVVVVIGWCGKKWDFLLRHGVSHNQLRDIVLKNARKGPHVNAGKPGLLDMGNVVRACK